MKWVVLLMAWGLVLPGIWQDFQLANSQSNSGVVTVHDRTGAAVTRLVDGSQITLEISSLDGQNSARKVVFRLEGSENDLAELHNPGGGNGLYQRAFRGSRLVLGRITPARPAHPGAARAGPGCRRQPPGAQPGTQRGRAAAASRG